MGIEVEHYVNSDETESSFVHWLICDECGKPITKASDAFIRPVKANPAAGQRSRCVILHKGDCDKAYNEKVCRAGWSEIDKAFDEILKRK